MEPVEDPAALFFRDARPRVVHGQADAAALRGDVDLDAPAVWRVTAGVVEQDAHEPVEPVRGRSHDGVGVDRRGGNLEFLAACLRDHAESVGRLGRQHSDVDRFGVGLPTS